MLKLFCAIVCLLLSAAAYADDQVIEKPLVAQSLAGFDQEATEIRAGMHEGGRYEFLKADDKSKIEARLNSMHALLEKHASQNDLNSADKIALVNAQEEVNAILKHNDSNRLVCESRAPIGSHLPVKTCRTFGDIEMQRQDAMKTRSDLDKSRVNKGGG
ncbi:MAG TPA: hypothetical protein VFE67_05580 [Rudaea sp.]|jgi:hypothetical protein|nr:hypothetical protein [Rudaea sp.]